VALHIIQWPSANFGYPQGHIERNGFQPIAICNHTMDGYKHTYHEYLADPTKNAANYSTYRDGHVEQHVMDWNAAWCNGVMHLPDLPVPWIRQCWFRHINPNLMTISIEHEGLTGVPLTEAQIVSTIALHRLLMGKYRIPRDRHGVVGHYQIDSVNKARCPGAAFPWDRLMRAVQL
jgi:N-acetyl-anhydromuramyl-L-alanine amidase AmpD